MKRDWKLGDVQVVLSIHPSHVQEFATWLHRQCAADSLGRSIAAQINEQGHGARLVVIDPENEDDVTALLARFVEAVDASFRPEHPGGWSVPSMQAALREFANPTPPKPEEPKNWGAVVEDRKGRYWVLIAPEAGIYANISAERRRWDEIDAVRIAHDGMPS